MSTETAQRKLSDLRVVDLKNLLEKRGLDRSGNKQILLERLQKALEDEGVDVNSPQFELDKKPAKRPSITSNQQENNTGKEKGEEDSTAEVDQEVVSEMKEEKIIEEKVREEKVKEETVKEETVKEEKVREEKVKEEQTVKVEVDVSQKKSPEEGGGDPFIRLTLEEEDGLQEEEEPAVKPPAAPAVEMKSKTEDKKSTSNIKVEEETTKEANNDGKKQESKKQGGNNSTVGASGSKSNSRTKKCPTMNRNLWITNLAQSTKAAELKQAFSAFGKVIGAKVVINAKYPSACCYGYVTMDTVEDADNCILKLDNTELGGHIIRIEKVRPDCMNAVKLNAKLKQKAAEVVKPPRSASSKSQPAEKKKDSKEPSKEAKEVKVEEKSENSSEKKKERSSRSHDRKSRMGDTRRRSDSKDQQWRSTSRGSRPTVRDVKELLTFDKIKEAHEMQRLRERERIRREETRRGQEEDARRREVERFQRSEAARLEREREKLRIEREKLEREKAEIIRAERDRQKQERQNLEVERLELQRVKLRMQQEEVRAVKRPAPYRREGSYEDRKRIATDRHYEVSPPSPRFESTNMKAREPTPKKFPGAVKDYKGRINYEKRDSYPPNKRDREFESSRSHPPPPSRGPPPTIPKYEGSMFNREIRDVRTRDNPPAVVGSRLVKESRYSDRDRSPPFRPLRDDRERRTIPEHKTDVRAPRDHRFGESTKGFDRNPATNNWNPVNKVFGSGPPPKTWGKNSWRPQDGANNSERWNASNLPRSSLSAAPFSGNSNVHMGPSCPPPPAINNYNSNRFDYKSISNIRKY